ncbi:MAG: hypothetical protein AB9856_06600 [Cellulosilyticaceae bacterium]
MDNLKLYLERLQEKYGDTVKLNDARLKEIELDKVPKELQNLYKLVSQANLPFGKIFSVERAIKESENEPFKSKWFVFGKDNYFSFWLCSYEKDKEGLSFTSWDHESGSEIGEAADEDIVSFLEYEEEEYGEYKEEE